MKIKIYKCFSLIILATFLFASQVAYSQPVSESKNVDFMLENYKEQYFDYNKGPRANKVDDDPNRTPSRYVYELPSTAALGHLYWAVNMYKLEDDKAVDEFMRLNECEIFKNFSSDEVEWRDIRDATREFLRENKEDFPTRFEFVLPLMLLDYDEKRRAFEIRDNFKITSLRRFELFATDARSISPCTRDHNMAKGYPRGIVLEFSRPFSLTHVPMVEAKAYDYIKRKLEYMKKKYAERGQTKKRMYELRTAYLVLKVKIFTYGRFLGLNHFDIPLVQMMGVLEGYEIYEDRSKENLFYSQNYVTNQNKGKLDVILKPQYEVLRKKSAGEGILH